MKNMITITVESNDLDWVCYYALQNINILTDNISQKKRIDRIRKAIAFAQKNPGTILDNALRRR